MKSNRPTNLSLSTVLAVNLKSPVAIASILHRVSGMVIFLLIPVLLYLLQESLASEEAFNHVVNDVIAGPVGGGLVFIALAALIFHFVAGVKHLIQDFGIGETFHGGRVFATVAMLVALLGIAAALVWMVI